ncbi:MAG: clostripain-related cysteine peptidase [Vulcanimicrobiota bacterium]
MIKAWTFMLYNAGQGQLARMATHSLQELEKVGSDSRTDVVALNYRETNGDCKYEGGHTYHLQAHGRPVERGPLGSMLSCALANPARLKSPVLGQPVAAGDSAKMSDAATLKQFLIESMERFPAEHFALAITGHGAAFQGQVITRGPGGRAAISNDQLAEVLREVREETGHQVDLVNLNTCYSANLESLYSLKEATSTVVASQDALAVATQPFAAVLSQLQTELKAGKSVGPAELGKMFVEQAAAQPAHQLHSPSLTAVDARGLDELGQAVARLQKECIAKGVRPAQLRQCLAEAVSVNFADGVQLTDLGSLAAGLSQRFPELREAATAVSQSLKQAVLAEQHATPADESLLSRLVRKVPGLVGKQKDLSGATGLTVFWDASQKERLDFIQASQFGRQHPIQDFMNYLEA